MFIPLQTKIAKEPCNEMASQRKRSKTVSRNKWMKQRKMALCDFILTNDEEEITDTTGNRTAPTACIVEWKQIISLEKCSIDIPYVDLQVLPWSWQILLNSSAVGKRDADTVQLTKAYPLPPETCAVLRKVHTQVISSINNHSQGVCFCRK